MKLRRWQSEAINSILSKFKTEQRHFLCLATPGAGKTLMASLVARQLMNESKIDVVLCFSPSVNVSNAFQMSLETHLECRLDGLLGSKGCSLTYQSMLSLGESFWLLLSQYRTLVIFDEIHHCAGGDLDTANSWGQKIIEHIQGQATYTLALTGTPWRSDKVPIALSTYCHENKIQCDYSYGLDQAIKDGVCRIPKITAIDNENIHLKSIQKDEKYTSFSDFLKRSKCSYQDLLENPVLIAYLINATSKKLDKIRQKHSNAGGLIVAASVDHAYRISKILYRETGENACIATYMSDNAQEVIRDFRKTDTKWIISVGMISEGTDIPRLRVCCHLTRVKTELYFRQVLGRILRSDGSHEESFLFMPAEPNLVEFAHRVAEDIPDTQTVTIKPMTTETTFNVSETGLSTPIETEPEPELFIGKPSSLNSDNSSDGIRSANTATSVLPETYDARIGLFGKFRQQIINLTNSGASI